MTERIIVETTQTGTPAPEHQPHPLMERIGEAMSLSQGGDRPGARLLFEEVWAELGQDGDAFQRCALAHSMADVQDDPRDELLWDQRALKAADAVTEERAQAGGVPTVRAFYPSLHLNLGDVHLRLGEVTQARAQLAAGRAAVGALAEDGYGRMIVGGLDRLAERIDATDHDCGPPVPFSQ